MTAKPYVYTTGRRSLESKMRLSELQEYDDKLTFIQAQAATGKLKRGWQSDAAMVINVTAASVSQIVTGRRKSPNMLEGIYQYVLNETKQVAIQDNGQRLEVMQALAAELEAEHAKLGQEIEGIEEAKVEELKLVEYRYQQRQVAISDQLTALEARLMQLRGRIEEVQIAYDLEYSDEAPTYVAPEDPRDVRMREISQQAGELVSLAEATRRAQLRDDLKNKLEQGQ